jgi:hypothetical protein
MPSELVTLRRYGAVSSIARRQRGSHEDTGEAHRLRLPPSWSL